MAAYASLTSLKQIIRNLHNHPFPPVPTDKQQVQSLTEVLTFLQDFLKDYNSSYAYSDEADPLETRIVDVALKAEDVIECKIVDQLRGQSTNPGKATGEDLYQDLQLVIEEMDLIKKMAMAIQTDNTPVRPQPRRNVSTAIGSSTSSSMVGFDDVSLQVLESLIGSQLHLQIIPITGMGGIGKTALARNLFENACVKEHFDIRAWTTISQDYNAQQALKELLSQAKVSSSGKSEGELGLELYQHLWGRRYLLILDDMWSIEVWDDIRRHLPDNNDGSRVIVTTRLSNLTSHLNKGFKMKFLNDIDSWNLFSKIVFGEESFPLELEDIGKKIARNCGGLPLSIITIGGLLAKSEKTRQYWEHIEGNTNPIVNSEDNEHCLRILKTSYNHLPVHLKPCFLYMGLFKEDWAIDMRTLIQMWVAEGFLEPTSDKSLKTIGEENLKELVDRNLVDEKSVNKFAMCYKTHDLLRDLCIREAKKSGFYVYDGEYIPQDRNSICRVVIREDIADEKFMEFSQSMSGVVSVISTRNNLILPFKLRLLRANNAFGEINVSRRNFYEFANLRLLFFGRNKIPSEIISSLNHFWNLHTVISNRSKCISTPPIWDMPHLREVVFYKGMYLPDPPTNHDFIMENLQTLRNVYNLKLSQELVKRIPNIKTMEVTYDKIEPHEDYYCLNYVECLPKLESFTCSSSNLEVLDFVKKLTFPQSLKKLEIRFNKDFELEEMLEKVGALPLLQCLDVYGGFFRAGEWRTVEGQFCRLEYLALDECGGLKRLTLESSHLPRLREIFLNSEELEEISSEIGDIPTLQEIDVRQCNLSTMMFLKKIVEEQEEFQGEEQISFKVSVYPRDDQVRWEEVVCSKSTCWTTKPHSHSVVVKDDAEALDKLKGPNFHIHFYGAERINYI